MIFFIVLAYYIQCEQLYVPDTANRLAFNSEITATNLQKSGRVIISFANGTTNIYNKNRYSLQFRNKVQTECAPDRIKFSNHHFNLYTKNSTSICVILTGNDIQLLKYEAKMPGEEVLHFQHKDAGTFLFTNDGIIVKDIKQDNETVYPIQIDNFVFQRLFSLKLDTVIDFFYSDSENCIYKTEISLREGLKSKNQSTKIGCAESQIKQLKLINTKSLNLLIYSLQNHSMSAFSFKSDSQNQFEPVFIDTALHLKGFLSIIQQNSLFTFFYKNRILLASYNETENKFEERGQKMLQILPDNFQMGVSNVGTSMVFGPKQFYMIRKCKRKFVENVEGIYYCIKRECQNNCQKCNKFSDKQCFECSSSAFLDVNSSSCVLCEDVITNCKECANSSNCLTCKYGFLQSQVCAAKPSFFASNKIVEILTDLFSGLNKCPNIRVFATALASFFCIFDDYWLYIYHFRDYGKLTIVPYVFSTFFEISNEKSMPYIQRISENANITHLIGSKFKPYTFSTILQNEETETSFLISAKELYVQAYPIDIVFYLLSILIFQVYCKLIRYTILKGEQHSKMFIKVISSIKRCLSEISQKKMLFVALLEANLSFIMFHCACQLRVFFSFGIVNKLSLLMMLLFLFTATVFSVTFYMLLNRWEKKKAECILKESGYYRKAFYFEHFFTGFRCSASAFVHGFFINHYVIQMSLLILIKITVMIACIFYRNCLLRRVRFLLTFTLCCYFLIGLLFDLFLLLNYLKWDSLWFQYSEKIATVFIIGLCSCTIIRYFLKIINFLIIACQNQSNVQSPIEQLIKQTDQQPTKEHELELELEPELKLKPKPVIRSYQFGNSLKKQLIRYNWRANNQIHCEPFSKNYQKQKITVQYLQ